LLLLEARAGLNILINNLLLLLLPLNIDDLLYQIVAAIWIVRPLSGCYTLGS
jgi:hypothetical protein